MGKDFPAQYGNSGQYANADGTFPAPSPTGMPRPQVYMPGPKRFLWTLLLSPIDDPPNPVGALYRYIWTSPTFDLRPDLRSGQGAPKNGLPVWSTAARLFVQIMGDPSRGDPPSPGTQPAINTAGLAVTSTEHVNIMTDFSTKSRPGEGSVGGADLVQLSTKDVSALFVATPGATAIVVGFVPPGTNLGGGEGYPVRYWRLQLTFDYFIPTVLPAPDPLPLPSQVAPGVILAVVY
jgi:hypothetical protein